MPKEREYKISESLVLAILSYLVIQPYQNVVELINTIQVELQGQAQDKIACPTPPAPNDKKEAKK